MSDSVRFRALRVEEQGETFHRAVKSQDYSDLPAGDVLIDVAYSSLNYKDALSATGNKGVTRGYPHTPGIDAAGTVISSTSDRFKTGDQVIVTSYDLGMNTAGGFAERIRVPADWVLPLPDGLSLREAMILGTAGFTAALCVDAIEQQGFEEGPVVVTGATGGVGSIAVALLAKLGKEVIASTGKVEATEILKALGASSVIDRQSLSETAKAPMLKGLYGAAVDTVGGETLVNLIKQVKPHASVAACGLVGGPKLELTVFPFILRGVNLLGIDSQSCPMAKRERIWQKLANSWKLDLEPITTEVSLEGLEPSIQAILRGQIRGRVLVNLAL